MKKEPIISNKIKTSENQLDSVENFEIPAKGAGIETKKLKINKEKLLHDSIKKYARNYFEDVYMSGGTSGDQPISHFVMDGIQHNLSVLAGCEKEWAEERLYTDNFREATSIFLEELISFSKEKEGEAEIKNFLNNIHETFFSSSPNIASSLNFEQYFNFASRATRSKNLQANIGGNIIGELAYKIGWGYKPEAKTDGLLNGYSKGSISEKLDKLNLMEVLGAELIGAGSTFNHGEKKITKLLNKIKKSNNNSFIGYYIDILEERLRQENKMPSRGPVQYSNDPGNARLRDSLTEEETVRSQELYNQIQPNRSLGREEKFMQIADDIVAILNHSNLPVAYAKVDLSGAKEQTTEISGTFMVNLKDALQNQKKGRNDIMLNEFIYLSNKHILMPRENVMDYDPEKLAGIWEKLGSLTLDEWKKYFELSAFRQGFGEKIGEFKKKKLAETEEKNFQATLALFEFYKNEIPSVLAFINNQRANDAYAEFIRACEAKDYEYAFDMASHLAMAFSQYDSSQINNPEIFSKMQSIFYEFKNLGDTHSTYWDEYNESINEYQNGLLSESQEEIVRFNEIIEKIEKDKDNIFTNFEIQLDKIIEEESKNKISAKFVSFVELTENEGAFSLKNSDVSENELLFQHLYRPVMKQRIENEFGIKFNELPFRYHVYFLKFLSEKNRGEVQEVKEFLNQGADKNNRIKAFLSLEFGQSLSENIFAISENLSPKQADLIFSKYAEIADLAYQAEREIMDSVKDKEKAKKIDPKKISQDLLKRGKDILSAFAKKIGDAKGKGDEISAEDILSDLKNYHKDLVFMAAVIKEGKREGLIFEDFEGAQFRVMSAREVFENKSMYGQMRKMYADNWQHEKPTFQAKLLKGFDEKIEHGGKDVALFIFEKGGEVAAFSRSDSVGPGRRFFASLNVKPSMQGSAIGWALKEASVAIEGKENDIEADCDPMDSRSTPVYINKDGYVATGAILNYEETGKYLLTILREHNPKKYYFRGKPETEVVEYFIKNNMNNKFNEGDKLIVLEFEPGSEEMKRVTDRLLNQEHYKITSYFFDTTGKKVYCAFEREGSSS